MATTRSKKTTPKASTTPPAPRVVRSKKAAAPKVATAPALPELIRERFSMPQADFDRIAALKARARGLGRPSKKNELLRAGLHALGALADEAFLLALDQLEPVKKPKAGKASKSKRPLDER
ncbi:MAG: hypothetical protein U1F26_11480 [Lysobacterales bacterium]